MDNDRTLSAFILLAADRYLNAKVSPESIATAGVLFGLALAVASPEAAVRLVAGAADIPDGGQGAFSGIIKDATELAAAVTIDLANNDLDALEEARSEA